MKTCFSDKSNNFENLTVVENEKVTSDEKELSEVFNKYFDVLLCNLNLKVPENLLSLLRNFDGPIFRAISKYQNYPSIKFIQTKR